MPGYRLEPVLKQREEEKKQAAIALGRANEALALVEKALQELTRDIAAKEKQKEQKKQEVFAKMLAGSMAVRKVANLHHEIKRMDLHIQDLNHALEQKQKDKQAAEAAVEQARIGLVEATKEYKAILKHKEKFLHKQREIAKKKEQKQMDEISSLIYNFKGGGQGDG